MSNRNLKTHTSLTNSVSLCATQQQLHRSSEAIRLSNSSKAEASDCACQLPFDDQTRGAGRNVSTVDLLDRASMDRCKAGKTRRKRAASCNGIGPGNGLGIYTSVG